jgi:acyl carrier protein
MAKTPVTLDNLRARLVTLFAYELGLDEEEITDDSAFAEDLGADSLDMIELVMEAETQLLGGAEIPDELAEEWTTFGKALAGITALIAARPVKPRPESIHG